jgi:hypothetical protein
MIIIVDPCPAAYMNEAHNSWVLNWQVSQRPNTDAFPGENVPPPDGSVAIDPYGWC